MTFDVPAFIAALDRFVSVDERNVRAHRGGHYTAALSQDQYRQVAAHVGVTVPDTLRWNTAPIVQVGPQTHVFFGGVEMVGPGSFTIVYRNKKPGRPGYQGIAHFARTVDEFLEEYALPTDRSLAR